MSNNLDPQIKWKHSTPVQIINNSRDILKYYAGKLETEQQTKDMIEKLIAEFYPNQLSLYFGLLCEIETWKIYWFFSPLYWQVPQILRYLSPISFPYLTKIVINQSHLYSIEQLAWLNCPLLKQIDIEENYIVCLKPLAKTNFPYMIVLKFYYNNFNHGQNQFLSRTKWNQFHPLGLYHFWKDIFFQHYFKFQPNQLKKIFVQKPKGQTLNNEKIYQKLQHKFIASQFIVHFSKN